MNIRLTIFFIFIIGSISAQENLQIIMPELDSVQIEKERKVLYQQLLSGTLNSGGLMNEISFPEFNFRREYAKRYNYKTPDFTFENISYNSFSPGSYFFTPSPFFSNGAVFSGSEYQINDKFTMGGYSFGANSIFSAPLPNQGMNNFDTRGSTFFMQYKVSKNFKIETRVSVSQGPGNGF